MNRIPYLISLTAASFVFVLAPAAKAAEKISTAEVHYDVVLCKDHDTGLAVPCPSPEVTTDSLKLAPDAQADSFSVDAPSESSLEKLDLREITLPGGEGSFGGGITTAYSMEHSMLQTHTFWIDVASLAALNITMADVQTAIGYWNSAVSGNAKYRLEAVALPAGFSNTDPNLSIIKGVSGACQVASGCFAAATLTVLDTTITATHIALYSQKFGGSAVTYSSVSGFNRVSAIGTLVHELGHALGLAHPAVVSSSTVLTPSPNYFLAQNGILPDDHEAIYSMYGTGELMIEAPPSLIPFQPFTVTIRGNPGDTYLLFLAFGFSANPIPLSQLFHAPDTRTLTGLALTDSAIIDIINGQSIGVIPPSGVLTQTWLSPFNLGFPLPLDVQVFTFSEGALNGVLTDRVSFMLEAA